MNVSCVNDKNGRSDLDDVATLALPMAHRNSHCAERMALDPWRAWVTAIVFVCVVGCVIRPLPVRCGRVKFDVGMALAPLAGVALLVATTAIGWDEVVLGIVGDAQIAPYGILILFQSLAYVCISLDLTGALAWLTMSATKRAGGSGRAMFYIIFGISSMLTICTSNDIVILTLTPIVVYYSKLTKVDPTPYLFAQFFAANLWSAALFIGNPTNIIVAEAFQVEPLEFSRWMAAPTVVCGVTSLVGLLWLFWQVIPERVADKGADMNPSDVLTRPGAALFGALWLLACLCTLMASSWIPFPLWTITLAFGVGSLLRDVIDDRLSEATPASVPESHTLETSVPENTALEMVAKPEDIVLHPAGSSTAVAIAPVPTGPLSKLTMRGAAMEPMPLSKLAPSEERKEATDLPTAALIPALERAGEPVQRFPTVRAALGRMPWKVIPLIIGMFVLVRALQRAGWVDFIAEALAAAIGDNNWTAVFLVGFVAALTCNVLNNQPTTVLFVNILSSPSFTVSGSARAAATFAVILASNLGANLTLIGALAGIMWQDILGSKGITMTYWMFVRVGFVVTPLALLAGLATIGGEAQAWDAMGEKL
jgi:Na+/H+ antiporter NhaD/arsenite permease-like protein